jgi:two-component system, cell cycle sensor histidine kinase and response regulator CckA
MQMQDMKANSKTGWGKVDAVRHTLFRRTLSLYLLLGLPAICIGAFGAVREGRWPYAVVYGGLYLLAVLVLAFSRRLPFAVAVASFLAFAFCTSIAVLTKLGLSGAGVPLLIAFCVLCTVLLDVRWGIAAIVLSLGLFVAVGAGMVLGLLPVPQTSAMSSASALSWVNFGFVFLLLAVVMVLSTQVLRGRLEKALNAAEENALRLQEVNRDLVEQNRIRREAEDALRLSEERYRLIVEHAAEAIFIAQDGILKFPNPSLTALLGYSVEETRSIPFVDYIHAEDRAMVAANHQRRLRGEFVPELYSFRILRKDGEERWAELNAVRISWDGRPATLNFARDITAQKHLEAQYRQAQKMEAVGTLAGGIAHDFNNLLQIIQGFAEALGQEADPGGPGYGSLGEIRKATARGGLLTRQLLTFSQKAETAKMTVDLNREVEKVRVLLVHVLPKMIAIDLRLAADPAYVHADAGQLEQALMNLAINARDAMPEGGRLTIETDVVRPTGEMRALHPELGPGDHVRLQVTDTGQGMSEEVRQRIFEPFFTTKAVGQGTGLGLAMVYGIVRSHGGVVSCDSSPGKGARFTILLPVAAGRPAAAEEDSPPSAAGGTGTILFVDDEEILRALGERLLRRAGYTVWTAPTGEKALEIYGGNPGKIDLVILDLMMPGMGGKACLREILALDPGARVLVSSGYPADDALGEGRIEGAAGILRKPYEAGLLLSKIREALRGAQPGPPPAGSPPA